MKPVFNRSGAPPLAARLPQKTSRPPTELSREIIDSLSAQHVDPNALQAAYEAAINTGIIPPGETPSSLVELVVRLTEVNPSLSENTELINQTLASIWPQAQPAPGTAKPQLSGDVPPSGTERFIQSHLLSQTSGPSVRLEDLSDEQLQEYLRIAIRQSAQSAPPEPKFEVGPTLEGDDTKTRELNRTIEQGRKLMGEQKFAEALGVFQSVLGRNADLGQQWPDIYQLMYDAASSSPTPEHKQLASDYLNKLVYCDNPQLAAQGKAQLRKLEIQRPTGELYDKIVTFLHGTPSTPPSGQKAEEAFKKLLTEYPDFVEGQPQLYQTFAKFFIGNGQFGNARAYAEKYLGIAENGLKNAKEAKNPQNIAYYSKSLETAKSLMGQIKSPSLERFNTKRSDEKSLGELVETVNSPLKKVEWLREKLSDKLGLREFSGLAKVSGLLGTLSEKLDAPFKKEREFGGEYRTSPFSPSLSEVMSQRELQTVNDVLEPQIDEKTALYKVCANELKNLKESGGLTREFTTLKTQMEQLKKEINDLEKQKDDIFTVANERLTSGLNFGELFRLQGLPEKMEKIAEDHGKLQEQLEKLEEEGGDQDKISKLKRRMKELQDEHSRLREEQSEIFESAHRRVLGKEILLREQKIKELDKGGSAPVFGLTTRDKELLRLQTEQMEAMRQFRGVSSSEISEKQKEIDALRENPSYKNYTNRLEMLQAELGGLQKDLRKQWGNNPHIQNQIKETEKKIDDLRTGNESVYAKKMNELQGQLGTLEKGYDQKILGEKNEQRQSVNKKIDDVNFQLDTLEKDRQKYLQENKASEYLTKKKLLEQGKKDLIQQSNELQTASADDLQRQSKSYLVRAKNAEARLKDFEKSETANKQKLGDTGYANRLKELQDNKTKLTTQYDELKNKIGLVTQPGTGAKAPQSGRQSTLENVKSSISEGARSAADFLREGWKTGGYKTIGKFGNTTVQDFKAPDWGGGKTKATGQLSLLRLLSLTDDKFKPIEFGGGGESAGMSIVDWYGDNQRAIEEALQKGDTKLVKKLEKERDEHTGKWGVDSIEANGGINLLNIEARTYDTSSTNTSGLSQTMSKGQGVQARVTLADAAYGISGQGGKLVVGDKTYHRWGFSANVDAMAGAIVNASASTSAGASTEGISAHAEANAGAMIGAKVGVSGGINLMGVSANVSASAWAGIGAKAYIGGGYKNGNWTFGGDFGLAFKGGAQIAPSISVNTAHLAAEIQNLLPKGKDGETTAVGKIMETGFTAAGTGMHVGADVLSGGIEILSGPLTPASNFLSAIIQGNRGISGMGQDGQEMKKKATEAWEKGEHGTAVLEVTTGFLKGIGGMVANAAVGIPLSRMDREDDLMSEYHKQLDEQIAVAQKDNNTELVTDLNDAKKQVSDAATVKKVFHWTPVLAGAAQGVTAITESKQAAVQLKVLEAQKKRIDDEIGQLKAGEKKFKQLNTERGEIDEKIQDLQGRVGGKMAQGIVDIVSFGAGTSAAQAHAAVAEEFTDNVKTREATYAQAKKDMASGGFTGILKGVLGYAGGALSYAAKTVGGGIRVAATAVGNWFKNLLGGK